MMKLKILLPSAVFLDVSKVKQIVIETPDGAYGLLPRRLDCSASIVPGIISYVSEDGTEAFVAVDEGVMVKHDQLVMLAVRRAFSGNNLALLHEQITRQFLQQGAAEANQQRLQQRLESGFLRRFADFRHE